MLQIPSLFTQPSSKRLTKMPWLVGSKPTLPATEGLVLEHLDRVPDFSFNELIPLVPINHGGVESDYTLFQITSQDSTRILNGETYTLTWADGNIVGISFPS